MAKGIVLKTVHAAGGAQLNGGQDWGFVDGKNIVVLGDPVAGHGNGQHSSPVMAEASTWMTINSKRVCRQGDHASCGHVSNGSDWFFIE